MRNSGVPTTADREAPQRICVKKYGGGGIGIACSGLPSLGLEAEWLTTESVASLASSHEMDKTS